MCLIRGKRSCREISLFFGIFYHRNWRYIAIVVIWRNCQWIFHYLMVATNRTFAFAVVLNVILLWIIQQNRFACSSENLRPIFSNRFKYYTLCSSIYANITLLDFIELFCSFTIGNHLNWTNTMWVLNFKFSIRISVCNFSWIVVQHLVMLFVCVKTNNPFSASATNISSQIVFDSWEQVERKCNTPFPRQ